MGRHAMEEHGSPQQRRSLAPWIWVLIALIAVALIAVSVWAAARDGDSRNQAASAPETTAQDAAATPGASSSATSPSAPASASPSDPSATSTAPAGTLAPPLTTLFLLDTSEGMTPYFAQSAEAISRAAAELDEHGKQVALWNYSSPLSAAATVGYRDNLGFGSSEEVPGVLGALGTGGLPQTRSAVLAALETASAQASASGEPARVVLVTTGTADDVDDDELAARIATAKAGEVELSIVQVGSGAVDKPLSAAADAVATPDTADPGALRAAILTAAGARA